MNDLDRLLRDSLKSVGDAHHPVVTPEVRARFRARLRRRRFAVALGGVAFAGATAAVVAVFLSQAPTPAPRREAPEVAALQIVEEARVTVGGTPDGLAVGDGGVWVANSNGNVQLIGHNINKVINEVGVGGKPEDVAVGGVVWVSGASGRLARLEPGNGTTEVKGKGFEGHTLDLAPTEDGALWVVANKRLYKVDAARARARHVSMDLEGVTDVAAGDDSVWVLDGLDGQIARVNPATEQVEEPFPLGTDVGDEDSDLAVGAGRVWVASAEAGMLLMFDPVVGEVTARVPFTGDYAGVAVDEAGAWLMIGAKNATGSLRFFDPETGKGVGDPLVLTGEPVDVAAGYGAAWVSDGATGTVLRVAAAPSTPR